MIAVGNKEVDAALGNKIVGLYHLQRNKMTELVKVVGETYLYCKKYGPAVRKDNGELSKHWRGA